MKTHYFGRWHHRAKCGRVVPFDKMTRNWLMVECRLCLRGVFSDYENIPIGLREYSKAPPPSHPQGSPMKVRKVRKPRPLDRETKTRTYDSYAGFFGSLNFTGKEIYMGASYYEEDGQIHVDLFNAKRLHTWLGKAINYLEQKERKG